MTTKRFLQGYREETTLLDGAEVRIRTLRPGDREKILEGFTRLSQGSRYMRFLSPKSHLTSRELGYLEELEGDRHFGIVAILLGPDGEELQGIGIARFVRSVEEPAVAEPAITVTDDFQGKGLGRLLCVRLADAAAERGIDHFRCYVLAENRRVQELIRRVFPGARFQARDGLIVAEFPVTWHL